MSTLIIRLDNEIAKERGAYELIITPEISKQELKTIIEETAKQILAWEGDK